MTTLDISNKTISPYLRHLIDKAKQSVKHPYEHTKTAKADILFVYNRAKKEGFTPFEARRLVEEEITTVSNRYLREILPAEAKQIQDHSRQNQLKNISAEQVPPEELNTNDMDNVSLTTKHKVIEIDDNNSTTDQGQQLQTEVTQSQPLQEDDEEPLSSAVQIEEDIKDSIESKNSISDIELQNKINEANARQKAGKFAYMSDEEFNKRVQHFNMVFDDFSHEQLTDFFEQDEKSRDMQKRLILNSFYSHEFDEKLEKYVIKWNEMKKLYVELIELFFMDNSSTFVVLEDAIFHIQNALKDNHGFSFTDALAKYVSEYFIDRDTQEYLIYRYGNEENKDLGFANWRDNLHKTAREREMDKMFLLEEQRKYWAENHDSEENDEDIKE